MYRAALNDLAESLDPTQFVRAHRSAIVNIESILRLEPISPRRIRSDLERRLESEGQQNLSQSVRKEIGAIAVATTW